MSAHIIGRPGDQILAILLGDDALGDGADPEQAFIGGDGQEKGGASSGRRTGAGDSPTHSHEHGPVRRGALTA